MSGHSYTGQVRVGGPLDVRQLPQATIAKLAVGPMSNNSYLVRCRSTGAALLIDAANEANRLVDFARFGGEPAGTVLTTHRHADHWQALAELIGQTGASTMAGVNDADGIPVPTERRLRHGDRVEVGELELIAIELRGHTPGSIALYYADPDGSGHLFTGDSLFPGGVGRTTKAADFQQLIGDVSERLFDVYDDDTWFYPGHGDDSTLGLERPHLAEWRERGW
jgi:glyoxylase-like metal-dependent hydrolase (beta-lactamase superfamily II)